MRLVGAGGAAALLLVGAVACTSSENETDSAYLPNQLGSAAPVPRSLVPRVSVSTRFTKCDSEPGNLTISAMTCGNESLLPTQQVLSVTAAASAKIDSTTDPSALHTVALSDMIWGNASGKTLDRSISYLSMASQTASSRKDQVLSDLSAALLVRAGRSQDVRDVFQSIEAAEAALSINKSSLAALFNLGLAFETAGIDRQAVDTWKRYLAVDPDSPWSNEVRLRLTRLQSARVPLRTIPVDRSLVMLRQFAKSSPQQARLYGWEVLLRQWGELVIANDLDSAQRIFQQAGEIVAGLRDVRGDGTLGSAVAVIQATQDKNRLKTLALAHVTYARAQETYKAGHRAAARAMFDSVERESHDSEALRSWTRLYRAATLVYTGDVVNGLRAMNRVVSTVKPQDVALKANATWMIGTTQLRQGQYEKALNDFLSASVMFESCGEHEYSRVMQILAADAQFKLGDAITAYATAVQALRSLRGYKPSVWTYTILAVLAAAASTDGLPDAALLIQTEGVAAASALGQPVYIAEARLVRARLSSGRRRDVIMRDIDSAAAIIRTMPDEGMRAWFHADLVLTRIEADAAPPAPAYRNSVDSAVATFEKLGNKLRLLAALIVRANWSLTDGNMPRARNDLELAVGLIQAEHDSITKASLRQSVLRSGQSVFARAVSLAVSQGDTIGGLKLLEQSRAIFSAAPQRTREARPLQTRIPSGTTAINYMALSDTLFVWVVNQRGTRLLRRELSGFQIGDSVSRLLDALESGAMRESTDGTLKRLYTILIAPIKNLWDPDHKLVFVGDGWVGAMPFGAVTDPVTQRYLIEDHAIAFAPTLPGSLNVRPGLGAKSALIVSDALPARGTKLETLEAAPSEARDIAALYPGATVLIKEKASGRAVLNAAATKSIFHFAGHAVTDELRPMESYLALSPESNGDTTGRLSAETIQRSRLNNLELVVLSACETVRPSQFGRGETGALLLAFLAAGAKEVVGSTWKIDDRSTGSLLTKFHRAYVRRGDAAEAMRIAQIEMIRSNDRINTSPSAWAGFHVQVY